MTEIITDSFYDSFINMCATSKMSIKLCAPFVKGNVIDDILLAKRAKVKVHLITKMNLKNFHNKASDVVALKKVLLNGGSVFNCSNLHAKVYIFDDSRCAITSANLTISGLRKNIECGVMIDDLPSVGKIIDFYDDIQMRNDVGRISNKNIIEIQGLLERLPQITPIKYPQFDISAGSDKNVVSIARNLTGWKRDVFLTLGQFEDEFTTAEIAVIAEQLRAHYPRNNNREAKVRQILQQLRDLGLVEFVNPGVYKKLWI